MRRIISGIMTFSLMLGSVFVNPVSVIAKENYDVTYQKVKDIKFDEYGTFIPFRSSFVRYISFHASEKSKLVKDIWKRLFYEENHYLPGASYYDSRYKSWGDKL